MSYFATDVLERCDVTPISSAVCMMVRTILYTDLSLKLLHVDDVMAYTLDTSPIINNYYLNKRLPNSLFLMSVLLPSCQLCKYSYYAYDVIAAMLVVGHKQKIYHHDSET